MTLVLVQILKKKSQQRRSKMMKIRDTRDSLSLLTSEEQVQGLIRPTHQLQ